VTSVLDVIDDPHLLGPFFEGSSWANWRIVLKATFGEPMTEVERDQFRILAAREPPPGRVREAFFAIGRRGGKDSVASLVALHAAVFGDFQRYLRPGERPVILCLAASKDQATGILSYISGYFDRVPMLAPLVQRMSDESISLTTGSDIIVTANSFRSIRGRTVAVAIFNEIAFWRDDRYANPDTETYSAVLPSLVTLRKAGSILIGISSVYRRLGLLYDKITAHAGKNDPHVLAIRAPSVTFNPTIDQADIDLDTALDPEKAAAEWQSVWRTDINTFVDRTLVESLVDRGVRERPYDRTISSYTGFADEAGGGAGGDSSTLSIVHQGRDGQVVQDLMRIWRAPFVPAAVVEEKAALLRSYGLGQVTMDHWAGGLPPSLYAAQGIRTEPAAAKSKLYLDFLGVLNSRRILMLDEPTQIAELCNLERRVAWGGHESVDHPLGGNSHDDAVNSLAGAAVQVATTPSQVERWIRAFGDPKPAPAPAPSPPHSEAPLPPSKPREPPQPTEPMRPTPAPPPLTTVARHARMMIMQPLD
jgi:hypothetical protein